MTEVQIHGIAVWAVIGMAVATFLYLLRFTAPFGRHYTGAGWGPHISNRIGWVVMELPTTVLFALIYFNGDASRQWVPLVFLAMWQAHYLHRTFVFPFRTRTSGKKMPLTVVGSGVLFNTVNAYINARFVSHIGEYSADWLSDPRFLVGLAIFLAGMALNIRSDNILLKLRGSGEGEGEGEGEYKIPRGGAFRYVSCPNYLGEIIEWAGWALATWSLAGFAFFLYTAANLAPRALSHHAWYRARFPDYPPNRKALIPGIL